MEFNSDVKNRLKRVEGQIRGVLRMMEEEQACKDVISQLSAVRSAVDRSIAYIVAQNLKQCIEEDQSMGENSSEIVEEAIELLVKSR